MSSSEKLWVGQSLTAFYSNNSGSQLDRLRKYLTATTAEWELKNVRCLQSQSISTCANVVNKKNRFFPRWTSLEEQKNGDLIVEQDLVDLHSA